MFKTGPLSGQEVSELNALRAEIERLKKLTVAGRTIKLHRGPANIVIEVVSETTQVESGSGSGSSTVDLGTHCWTYLSDVVFGTATVACQPNGTVMVTIPVTKYFVRTCITAADLTGFDTNV
jgi:hypothetical protein